MMPFFNPLQRLAVFAAEKQGYRSAILLQKLEGYIKQKNKSQLNVPP